MVLPFLIAEYELTFHKGVLLLRLQSCQRLTVQLHLTGTGFCLGAFKYPYDTGRLNVGCVCDGVEIRPAQRAQFGAAQTGIESKAEQVFPFRVPAALVNGEGLRWSERVNLVIVGAQAAVDHVVPAGADEGYRVNGQQAIRNSFIDGAAQKRKVILVVFSFVFRLAIQFLRTAGVSSDTWSLCRADSADRHFHNHL